MGRTKALLPFGAATVVESVASAFTAAPSVEACLVVVGHEGAAVAAALRDGGVTVVTNAAYRDGMLSSIQAGLRALPGAPEAILVALVDQPGLRSQTVERLVAAHAEDPGSLVLPVHGGRRGHPLVLSASDVVPVLALPRDASLRDHVRAQVHRLRLVDVDDPAVVRDVDDPADYRRALAEAGLPDSA